MPSRSLPLIVSCHVRDLDTGALSRKIEYYREVTKRIRSAEVDVVLNLTAGMGGGMLFGSSESPLPLNDTLTDMVGAKERLLHIEQCNPEICTLDCGTMNFADEGLIEDPVLIRLCRGVLGVCQTICKH
jgi:uncharacterized protein (DUF849 family)